MYTIKYVKKDQKYAQTEITRNRSFTLLENPDKYGRNGTFISIKKKGFFSLFVIDSFQITYEDFLSVLPVKIHVEEVICRNGRLECEDNECRLYITKNLVLFPFFKFFTTLRRLYYFCASQVKVTNIILFFKGRSHIPSKLVEILTLFYVVRNCSKILAYSAKAKKWNPYIMHATIEWK